MWKNKITSCIENEALSTRQITTNSKKDEIKHTHDVRRFCRVTKKGKNRKRGRKPKEQKETKNEKTKIPQQSHMQRFFTLPPPPNENEDTQTQTKKETDQNIKNEAEITNEVISDFQTTLRRSTRKRKQIHPPKQVNELDDYKIIRRTNMITYQRRLKAFQKNKQIKNSLNQDYTPSEKNSNNNKTGMNKNVNNETNVTSKNNNTMKKYMERLSQYKKMKKTNEQDSTDRFKRRTRSPSPELTTTPDANRIQNKKQKCDQMQKNLS